jgi:hypothetical protein
MNKICIEQIVEVPIGEFIQAKKQLARHPNILHTSNCLQNHSNKMAAASASALLMMALHVGIGKLKIFSPFHPIISRHILLFKYQMHKIYFVPKIF